MTIPLGFFPRARNFLELTFLIFLTTPLGMIMTNCWVFCSTNKRFPWVDTELLPFVNFFRNDDENSSDFLFHNQENFLGLTHNLKYFLNSIKELVIPFFLLCKQEISLSLESTIVFIESKRWNKRLTIPWEEHMTLKLGKMAAWIYNDEVKMI